MLKAITASLLMEQVLAPNFIFKTRHFDREWFIVPLDVIETAVRLLINGEIIEYRYDSQEQKIVGK